MRILMIGATGTIGRRLLLHRLSLGDSVTILSRNAMRTRRLLSALGHTGIPIVEGDTSVRVPGRRRWMARMRSSCSAGRESRTSDGRGVAGRNSAPAGSMVCTGWFEPSIEPNDVHRCF